MFVEIDNNHFVNPDNIISINKINTKTELHTINGNQLITPKAIKVIAARLKFVQISNETYINPKNVLSIDVLDKYTRINTVRNTITLTKSIQFAVSKLNGKKPVAKKIQ